MSVNQMNFHLYEKSITHVVLGVDLDVFPVLSEFAHDFISRHLPLKATFLG